ncbi:PREDICTED: calcitonin receptor-like [Papilio xuthus]|uniref:Calcitonin receptor-like n=1 Tax=Papilio xuthus TaxID=66420 RepID=A0AAJ7EIU5_PAPXU|nr:PREDICTED: calcitonin receptor-like [Papilio xuthus]
MHSVTTNSSRSGARSTSTEDEFRKYVNDAYVYLYSISSFCAIFTMGFLRSTRVLQLTRLYILLHLYLSYLVNNVLWMLWYRLVLQDDRGLKLSALSCQLLHAMSMYGMLSSYMWMFVEGLHLYISRNFECARCLKMKMYICLGWVSPAINVLIYAIVRTCYANESDSAVVEH